MTGTHRRGSSGSFGFSGSGAGAGAVRFGGEGGVWAGRGTLPLPVAGGAGGFVVSGTAVGRGVAAVCAARVSADVAV
ncbi:hypothetical protein CP976_27350 [Streptomyces coeruleorubidus]|uniref:Uncharacterized protein n=1 Tax=Streptomyces coeruleorubidus TaxID=116188 RepID=A0A5J6IF67_STRC4|nr:hypothetical protein CP976_27350 [Streptomyces coeruleorubidus]